MSKIACKYVAVIDFNIGRMLNESFESESRDSSFRVCHASTFLEFPLTHCYVSRVICLISRFLTVRLTLLLRLVILSPFFGYLLFPETILFRLSLRPLADPGKYVPSRERRLAHLGLRILLFLPVWLLHVLVKIKNIMSLALRILQNQQKSQ